MLITCSYCCPNNSWSSIDGNQLLIMCHVLLTHSINVILTAVLGILIGANMLSVITKLNRNILIQVISIKKSLCYMNFNSLIIRHYSNLAPITSRKTAESHYFYWYIDHLRAIFLYVLFLIKPNILVLPQHRYSLRVNLLFDSWWWNCLFVAKLVGEKTEIRYH